MHAQNQIDKLHLNLHAFTPAKRNTPNQLRASHQYLLAAVNNGCGSSATFMSAAGVGTAKSKQHTANTKRNTKSKATTAMKTTKFFFLTANDNHSPFIFSKQNFLKC